MISSKTLNQGGQSLKSILKAARKPKEATPVKHRNKPENYAFSEEIHICCSVLPNRKNRVEGKAYYKPKCPRKLFQSKGIALPPATVKGLRGKTKEEVIQNLEQVPYYDEYAPVIILDISNQYAEKKQELSLKTIWFLNRLELLQDKDYNDSLARELFACGEGLALYHLHPANAFPSDYEDAVREALGQRTKQEEYRYWRQLHRIVKLAVKKQYMIYDPLREIVSNFASAASAEQTEVRNALTKKQFKRDEEAKILAFLCEELPEGKRYVRESLALGAAIRYFTGMRAREVCALLWEDLIKLPNLDGWQFLVSKVLSDDGTLSSQSEQSEWDRFRRVPVPGALAEMLLERKRLLLGQGFDEKALQKQPLLLKAEPRSENRNSDQLLHCTPRQLQNYCNKVIEQADIKEQMLSLPDRKTGVPRIVDANHYMGDLFQKNFQYAAKHTCGLTRGELAYVLGNTPQDTFSRHYCDYANNMIQYMMCKKLERWTARCMEFARGEPPRKYPEQKVIDEWMDLVDPTSEKVAGAVLTLESKHNTHLEVQVQCEHGCSGTFTWYGKEAR